MFILNDSGEQRGSVQRINLKNQDDVQRIWTRILVKPGLNCLKAAAPLVLNRRCRCSTDTLPILDQLFTDSLLTHFRYHRGRLSTDMSTDTQPICRLTLDRYSTDMSVDTPYKTQDPIILTEQNFCLQFSLHLFKMG